MFGSRQKIIKVLILSFVVWSIIALIFTIKHSMSATSFGREFSFFNTFTIQFVSCMGWVLLTPAIVLMAEHFLPKEKNYYRNIFILLAFGIGVILLQTAYQTIFLPLMGFGKLSGFDTFGAKYQSMFISNWVLSGTLYLMTLGVTLTVTYYRKYQKRELLSSKLEANLNRARLQVLQMQLHPHFLFNTHNAITELIHKDPHTAEKMLTNLSYLLRISLEKLETEETSFRKELEFVEKYIEIEQMRFQERLKFILNIAPETLDAIVPNMILQPLIENAVKHGITPLKKGGTIQIDSNKKGDYLFITVSDDGVGGAGGEQQDLICDGIGLANTQARLQHLYKDQQSFQIKSGQEKGFSVLLKIPFKTANKDSETEKNVELINPKLAENN